MKFYNTLSRKKEEFIPIKKTEVSIYACGPTVYNYIHIGNARPICVFDTLRRYLMKFKNYKVNFVQNFTDIDDKIIKKASEEHTDYISIADKYIKEYKVDAAGLNVLEADTAPRATENIEQIKSMVQQLIDKGFAYVTANGDVYFKTAKFSDYGKLSHQDMESLENGSRIQLDDQKEDPADFAIWKAAKTGEPYWEAPWGEGRPGWHIECSVMAREYLGDSIDIHCGGQDLIFPHHENEIAQSEACTGKIFAKYWLHNGYINIDNKKMSKSANNFFTVREIAQKYNYEAIRYIMISSHYRNPVNFNLTIVEQACRSLDRLYNCKDNLTFKLNNIQINTAKGQNSENLQKTEEIKSKLQKHREDFVKHMDDDLNTADALSDVFELVRDINTLVIPVQTESQDLIKYSLELLTELSQVLGLLFGNNTHSSSELQESEIEKLINERNVARKNKDFATADAIRDKLLSQGISLEDTSGGTKWKKIDITS